MGCVSSSAASSNHAKPKPGQGRIFFDTYVLGSALGHGRQSQVRDAIFAVDASSGDVALPPSRAVKIIGLVDEHRNTCGRKLARAREEVEVWRELGEHPHLVSLHEEFFQTELCFVVMEKCGPLLHHLENMHQLTELSLGQIFIHMLRGINHLSNTKIVHRDIKIDSFLIGGEDGQTVKLTDFSNAASLVKQETLRGGRGAIPFMCPEMIWGEAYGLKADIWSFGVVVYILLFGQLPYTPDRMDRKSMLRAIKFAQSPTLFKPIEQDAGQLPGHRSEEVVHFAQSLLNRNPAQRPSARDALKFAYLKKAGADDCDLQTELPSLKPMLVEVRKICSFAASSRGDIALVIDDLLRRDQWEKHRQPLPELGPPGYNHATGSRQDDLQDSDWPCSRPFAPSASASSCGSYEEVHAKNSFRHAALSTSTSASASFEHAATSSTSSAGWMHSKSLKSTHSSDLVPVASIQSCGDSIPGIRSTHSTDWIASRSCKSAQSARSRSSTSAVRSTSSVSFSPQDEVICITSTSHMKKEG